MTAATRQPPEIVAALVNAAIVFLVPVVLMIAVLIAASLDTSHAGVVAYVTSPLWRAFVTLLQIVVFVTAIVPFATMAAWRTWVHARRYLRDEGTGWQGVVEAGGIGFFTAIWVLQWGIIHRPAEAPPYIIAYGGAALIIGVALGLILRFAAIVVLRRMSPGVDLPPHIVGGP